MRNVTSMIGRPPAKSASASGRAWATDSMAITGTTRYVAITARGSTWLAFMRHPFASPGGSRREGHEEVVHRHVHRPIDALGGEPADVGRGDDPIARQVARSSGGSRIEDVERRPRHLAAVDRRQSAGMSTSSCRAVSTIRRPAA